MGMSSYPKRQQHRLRVCWSKLAESIYRILVYINFRKFGSQSYSVPQIHDFQPSNISKNNGWASIYSNSRNNTCKTALWQHLRAPPKLNNMMPRDISHARKSKQFGSYSNKKISNLIKNKLYTRWSEISSYPVMLSSTSHFQKSSWPVWHPWEL